MSGLPGFLTSFGLNLLSTPPQGNIFQTAAQLHKILLEDYKLIKTAAMKLARVKELAEKRAFK